MANETGLKKRFKSSLVVIALAIAISAGTAYIMREWKSHEGCKCDLVVIGAVVIFLAFVLVMHILYEFGVLKQKEG